MVILSELDQLIQFLLLILYEIIGDVFAKGAAQRLGNLKVDHKGHNRLYNLRNISVFLYSAVHFLYLALEVPESLLKHEELIVLHLDLLHAFLLYLELFKDLFLRIVPGLDKGDLVGIHLLLQLLLKSL